MGLGGYLAARTDAEHYAAEESRENYEIDHLHEKEVEEVETIFREYGLEGKVLQNVVNAIAADRRRWVDFMMRFELGLERPDPKRAPISAATIGGSYVVGGLIPLIPYMLAHDIATALRVSIAATGLALLCFGAVKGHFTGVNNIRSALQTLLVGGLAAAAAYWLAHLFG
jgi:VIT1/CCC1 family predicted Fe2+/Mn2+ transporter